MGSYDFSCCSLKKYIRLFWFHSGLSQRVHINNRIQIEWKSYVREFRWNTFLWLQLASQHAWLATSNSFHFEHSTMFNVLIPFISFYECDEFFSSRVRIVFVVRIRCESNSAEHVSRKMIEMNRLRNGQPRGGKMKRRSWVCWILFHFRNISQMPFNKR